MEGKNFKKFQKVSKNSRTNKCYRFSFPLCQNRECVYFASTLSPILLLFLSRSLPNRTTSFRIFQTCIRATQTRKGWHVGDKGRKAGENSRRKDGRKNIGAGFTSRVKAYRAETAVPVPPIARFAPSSSLRRSSVRRTSSRASRLCVLAAARSQGEGGEVEGGR